MIKWKIRSTNLVFDTIFVDIDTNTKFVIAIDGFVIVFVAVVI